MFTTRKGLLAIILMFLFMGAGKDLWQFGGKESPVITEQAKTHILYGDARGGGHLAGINKPCKSEFPEDWNPEKVLEEINTIAANDNLNWARQDNGYYKVEKMVEDVRVRVIVNRRENRVVTAYPTNVSRNPCPAPANDNSR